MGEEYGEVAPFPFFADYGDAEAARGLREGRKREFESFRWGGGEPPDPLAEKTFLDARLRWECRDAGFHAELLRWHRDLLALRREAPFRNPGKAGLSAEVVDDRGILLRRRAAPGEDGDEAACLFNFSDRDLEFALPSGAWRLALDSRRVGKEPDPRARSGSLTVPGWTTLVLRRGADVR